VTFTESLMPEVHAQVCVASRGLIRQGANSNNDLPRAQFVPNTPYNCGHSRLAMVSVFVCM
jgi:hypothetical protein